MKYTFHSLRLITQTVACVLIALCSCRLLHAQPLYAVGVNGALSVKGVQIVNAKGTAVALAGPSLFWSNTGWGGEEFYNAQTVAWAKHNWQATLIRAALGVEGPGGYLTSQEPNKKRVFDVIDAALAEDMYVLVDWHDHHAEQHVAEASVFFAEVAKKYGKSPNIIYEIYNEPKGATWDEQVKPYAETLIKVIRSEDPDNLIVVGTPNWSQDVDVAAKNPIKTFKNIVYSLHFYAGTHHESLRNKAQKALDLGLPLMVTEWGAVNADGAGKVNAAETGLWMNFLNKNKISHCNWAVSAKNEGASQFNVGVKSSADYSDTQMTASGLLARQWVRVWYDLANLAPTKKLVQEPKS